MLIDDNILIQYIDNTLSAEEKAYVETWLATSVENEKILEQMYFTLQLTERMRIMNAVDTDKAFARFKQNTKRQNRRVGLGLRLGLQRVAAILFIPLLVLTGYLLMRGESTERLQMVEINTNSGVVSTFELPDGSKVWLNANSSLKYDANLNAGKSKRIVELNGEGFFEVEPNSDRPFIVQINPSYSVEVLGTSFNISAYAEDDIIETTLLTGTVKLNYQTANGVTQSKKLNPNEKAEYEKKGKDLTIDKTNPDVATGWKNGEIIFRQEPMENVLKTLSRHYNVTFDVKNLEVMNAVITARFVDEQLPQVLEYLKTASNITYTIKKSQVDDKNIVQKTIVEIGK